MKIILHAGQHKTGTTSVQSYLRDNRDALADAGLFVPSSGMNEAGSHRPLVAQLAGRENPRAAPTDWSAMLARELSSAPQDRAIISAELAKHVIVEGDGGRLVDGLRAAGASHVQIILYLRSPFALVNASYSQRTGALINAGLTFDQYIGVLEDSSYFNYGQFLELERRPDVDLTVLPYNAAARENVICDLCQFLGIGQPAPPGVRLNATHGPMYLEVLRVFSRDQGLYELKVRNLLREALIKAAQAWPEQPFWAVDKALERRLVRFDAATELFAHKVWRKPWRSMIGEEIRPLNIFDCARSKAAERERYTSLQQCLEQAAAEVLRTLETPAVARRGVAALQGIQ